MTKGFGAAAALIVITSVVACAGPQQSTPATQSETLSERNPLLTAPVSDEVLLRESQAVTEACGTIAQALGLGTWDSEALLELTFTPSSADWLKRVLDANPASASDASAFEEAIAWRRDHCPYVLQPAQLLQSMLKDDHAGLRSLLQDPVHSVKFVDGVAYVSARSLPHSWHRVLVMDVPLAGMALWRIDLGATLEKLWERPHPKSFFPSNELLARWKSEASALEAVTLRGLQTPDLEALTSAITSFNFSFLGQGLKRLHFLCEDSRVHFRRLGRLANHANQWELDALPLFDALQILSLRAALPGHATTDLEGDEFFIRLSDLGALAGWEGGFSNYESARKQDSLAVVRLAESDVPVWLRFEHGRWRHDLRRSLHTRETHAFETDPQLGEQSREQQVTKVAHDKLARNLLGLWNNESTLSPFTSVTKDQGAVFDLVQAACKARRLRDGNAFLAMCLPDWRKRLLQVQQLALSGKREDLEKLAMLDCYWVLHMRHRWSAMALAALTPEQVQGAILDNETGYVDASWGYGPAQVEVTGDTAIAFVRALGMTLPFWHCTRVEGEWKLDEVTRMKRIEEQLESLKDILDLEDIADSQWTDMDRAFPYEGVLDGPRKE